MEVVKCYCQGVYYALPPTAKLLTSTKNSTAYIAWLTSYRYHIDTHWRNKKNTSITISVHCIVKIYFPKIVIPKYNSPNSLFFRTWDTLLLGKYSKKTHTSFIFPITVRNSNFGRAGINFKIPNKPNFLSFNFKTITAPIK